MRNSTISTMAQSLYLSLWKFIYLGKGKFLNTSTMFSIGIFSLGFSVWVVVLEQFTKTISIDSAKKHLIDLIQYL
jgi:hypothetical protein